MFFILSCSCLCPIHSSLVLRQEWRCSWSSAYRRCSNYIWVCRRCSNYIWVCRRCSNYNWVINNFIAYYGATYIRVLRKHKSNHSGIIWHLRLTEWFICRALKCHLMPFISCHQFYIEIIRICIFSSNSSQISNAYRHPLNAVIQVLWSSNLQCRRYFGIQLMSLTASQYLM